MGGHGTARVDVAMGELPSPGERLAVYPNNANSALALQSVAILTGSTETDGSLIELVHDT